MKVQSFLSFLVRLGYAFRRFPVLSSFYSTYGYEDGVKLKSGTVEVLIDEETKAYTFNADIYLIDGRHMVATYTGDVEGMEVVDIITLNTVFTSAAAQKLESDGSNWLLTLSDDAGNTAVIDLFTYATPYIPESSYTIQFEDITTTEFDGNTSYFILAEEPETEVGFATGTLHVTIDWDSKMYDLSFYGSLTNGVVLETSYEGEIEGVSLEQSTEVINLEMTGATAHSYESGANWYLTFTDKEEQHRLTIDAYCTPSQALPEGQYVLGTGQGKIAYDATSITVVGEGQFNFQEVTMDVTIDIEPVGYDGPFFFDLLYASDLPENASEDQIREVCSAVWEEWKNYHMSFGFEIEDVLEIVPGWGLSSSYDMVLPVDCVSDGEVEYMYAAVMLEEDFSKYKEDEIANSLFSQGELPDPFTIFYLDYDTSFVFVCMGEDANGDFTRLWSSKPANFVYEDASDAQEFVDNYIYNTNNSPAPYRSEANAEVLKSDGNLNILR